MAMRVLLWVVATGLMLHFPAIPFRGYLGVFECNGANSKLLKIAIGIFGMFECTRANSSG